MATVGVDGTSRHAPRGETVERDDSGAAPGDLCAAVMAMAGHDLRQPLQVIIGAHDVLARSLSGGAERMQLTMIADAAMRLAGTLDQLVETVRLHEPSSGDRHQPVSLRPILADLEREFTAAAKRKGVELPVVPTSVVVSSHPVLLNGMLSNLIRNAIDYTPRGGRVLVACRKRGSETHIEVRDSGVGIPPGELRKIFEAFHRADAIRADGLGLGLFIVRRAAQVLGNRVEVRSALGCGSCFVVAAKRPFAQGS